MFALLASGQFGQVGTIPFKMKVIQMPVKTIYRVRVWAMGGTYNGKTIARSYRELIVHSMRAAIALTLGLSCDWEVLREGKLWGDYAFIGNEQYISPSDKHFEKQWKHNLRAFRCTLPKWSREDLGAVYICGGWSA